MNFSRSAAVNFQCRGHDFPSAFTAVHLEAMLDQTLTLFGTGSDDGHENPVVAFEPMQRFHLTVGQRHHFRMVISGFEPRLLTHNLAGVVEKNAKLFSID